jgi:hypothetical protein
MMAAIERSKADHCICSLMQGEGAVRTSAIIQQQNDIHNTIKQTDFENPVCQMSAKKNKAARFKMQIIPGSAVKNG